mgnify:CR=1 FL=1
MTSFGNICYDYSNTVAIFERKCNGMRVTTQDIAKAAGVSQSTVSVVLSNNKKISISPETRAHVLKVAENLGYQFKKRVVAKEDMPVVGILVPTWSNLYYPFLVQDIELYARSKGLTVVIQNTMRSEEGEIQAIQYLRSVGAQGILSLFAPKSPLPEDIPSVIIGEKLAGTEVDTISLNSYAAGRIAAEHMLSLGHKDVAFLSTPLSNITEARRKRLEGVRDQMEEAGLGVHLHVLVDENENEVSNQNYEFDCGMYLTEKLLQQKTNCTAIIAVNDMTAMGCISALNQHNIRIPDEMAVCGFDNLQLHRLTNPQLTSVDQMAFHGCKVGLSILMEQMSNFTLNRDAVYMEYKPRIYARGSTVKP